MHVTRSAKLRIATQPVSSSGVMKAPNIDSSERCTPHLRFASERAQPWHKAWQARAAAAAAFASTLGLAGSCASRTDDGPACQTVATDVYHSRIQPLLKEENAKTCNQCHLSGVDLKSFVRSTPCETMACLTERGLVDLATPADSKILGWILRAKPDSKLITEDVIRAEHDGFLQWIEAAAACPEGCEGVSCGTPRGASACNLGPAPNEPSLAPTTFDCSDRAIEQLFYDDVYAFRDRCFPCHFSSEEHATAAAPRWIRNDGNCATSSVETLRIIERRGLMNLEDPEQSLLLLKPLAEVGGGVPHAGEDKFESTEDPAYLSYLDFITHYAACKSQERAPQP